MCWATNCCWIAATEVFDSLLECMLYYSVVCELCYRVNQNQITGEQALSLYFSSRRAGNVNNLCRFHCFRLFCVNN